MNLKKINKSIAFTFMLIWLCACDIIVPYTTPVIQGKKIENKQIFEIKPNMTKTEIIRILGSPDIVDTFNPSQYIYVYTYKKNTQSKKFSQSKLILTFSDQNKLVKISGNYNPPTKDRVF